MSKHDPVRVSGTVRGPITLRQIGKQAVEKRKRKAVRTLTLKRQREDWAAWKARLEYRLKLGPQIAWVARKREKLRHPFKVTVRHQRAGDPQTTPGCKIHPRDYIGQKPKNGRSRGRLGFCAGCGLELELDWRGRIPEHVPGRPPYRECPSCGISFVNAWPKNIAVRKAGGIYNALQCPRCTRAVDESSTQNEGNSYDYEEDAPSVLTGRSWS